MLRNIFRALAPIRRYTPTHEWVEFGEKRAKIGITEFAVKQLGEVVYVDLPNSGLKFIKGSVFATVESVKAVGEVYCPVKEGKVVAINEGLKTNVSDINEDPEGRGWLVEMEGVGFNEAGLLEKADYEKVCSKGDH